MLKKTVLSFLPLFVLGSFVACSDGADGEPGPAGIAGKDGQPGVDGKDGSDGSNGKDGSSGKDGTDGEDAGSSVGGEPIALRGQVVHEILVDGAEMLDVSADGQFTLVAGEDTVTYLKIGSSRLEFVSKLVLPAANRPEGVSAGEFTGVSIHPNGAYALVAVRDAASNVAAGQEKPGKVLAVSLPELEVLGEITVGIGPDSVSIASNGEFAVVANEDEEDEEDLTSPARRAGTLSIIDLRDGPDKLTQVEVSIPADNIPFFSHDPQPETVRVAPDSSFIVATLQENNAIARVEVPSPLPSPLTAEAFTVTNFDAGLRTGLGLVRGKVGQGECQNSSYDWSLREEFTSAREPDGIALTPDGKYFVTADEDNLTFTNQQKDTEGRPLSGHGSRTISVYDAETGELLGDSGNSIEEAVIALGLPQRCDTKGPEPEVVDVGVIQGRTLAFVAIERSDAISIHDITDPKNIRLLDMVILNPSIVKANKKAAYEPEGIVVIPERQLVVVSNPAKGSVSLIELRTQSLVGGGSWSVGDGTGPSLPPVDCAQPVPGQASVVLSEICSSCDGLGDFIELYNNGTEAVDLTGWQLRDDSDKDIFTFPAQSTIAAGAYLTLGKSGEFTGQPAHFFDFGLGKDDAVRLYTPCDAVDAPSQSHSWLGGHVSSVSWCESAWVATSHSAGHSTPGAANHCD